jgi:hypothetical protein
MDGEPTLENHENWMAHFPRVEKVPVDPLMRIMRKTDNWISRRMAYLESGLKAAEEKLARSRSADRTNQLKGAIESWKSRMKSDPIDVTFSEQSMEYVSLNCPKCGASLLSWMGEIQEG